MPSRQLQVANASSSRRSVLCASDVGSQCILQVVMIAMLLLLLLMLLLLMLLLLLLLAIPTPVSPAGHSSIPSPLQTATILRQSGNSSHPYLTLLQPLALRAPELPVQVVALLACVFALAAVAWHFFWRWKYKDS